MQTATIIADAVELLRCAAEGSFLEGEPGMPIDTDRPSLIEAVRELYGSDYDNDSADHKMIAGIVTSVAFRALNEADAEYGASFASLYSDLDDDAAHFEGMRHAFLEAAAQLEERHTEMMAEDYNPDPDPTNHRGAHLEPNMDSDAY